MEIRKGFLKLTMQESKSYQRTGLFPCPSCKRNIQIKTLITVEDDGEIVDIYCQYCRTRDKILKEIEEHHEGHRYTQGYDIKKMFKVFIDLPKQIFNIVMRKKK